MSNAPTPPPDVLRVLLRVPFDAVAARRVVKRPDVQDWMTGIAVSVWHKDRTFRDTFSKEDFAIELIGALWMKLAQLRRQPDDRDPAAYLAGMLRNLAKDEWRRRAAQKRGGGQIHVDFDENTQDHRHRGAAVQVEAEHRVERLIATARRDGVLTPVRRAVFVGMIAPRDLASNEVVEAGESFVRGPDVTMTFVKRMLRNTAPPALDKDSEHTFVWIARCPDAPDTTPGWGTWLSTSPNEARTARDTVQRNFRRAREDVVKAVKSEGGEA